MIWLLIGLTPPWFALAVWHYQGYFNGRYDVEEDA